MSSTKLSLLFIPLSQSSSSIISFSYLFALSFLLSLLSLPLPISSLNVYVKANDEECFFEDLDKGEKLLGTYSVQEGGYLDIDVKVFGPDQRIVYEEERSKEGTFQFKSQQLGPHRVCFSNTMSLVSGKTLSFNLYTGHQLLANDAAKAEHLTPLDSAVQMTAEGIYSVHDTQVFLRYREQRHSETVESNLSRAFWWNFLEVFSLVAISIFNILFIRNLFEKSAGRR